ncbi:MAG: NADH dehydrogenase [ubiquinone] 1 alpha subcomplex assembly factor 1 [Candidatus Azotimanducaceae bacterium]|jgi:NADH dehydrogenase [ubiquinone] 1 alpha subcomplex assembly factor 1
MGNHISDRPVGRQRNRQIGLLCRQASHQHNHLCPELGIDLGVRCWLGHEIMITALTVTNGLEQFQRQHGTQHPFAASHRKLRMKPLDFDTSLRRSPASSRRRRSLQRVLGTAGIALALASCGSDTPASTAAPSTAAPSTAAPSTLAVPAPTRADNPPTTIADNPPTTIADPPATPAATCRRLTDFDDSDFDRGWAVVNDGVMGGRSNGALEFTDSAMRFTGDVVTAGGGFTSVRLQLTGDELTDSGYLALRVRSDERTYGLTLQDSAQTGRRPIAHGADLTIDGPSDADGWQTATTSYDELRPSVFGQSLDAPAFDPDQAVEIGIIISDGIDGPFELGVDWIDACSTP